MFPGDQKNGWPSFSEICLTSEGEFDEPMLDWLSRILEPLTLEGSRFSLESVLGQLMSDNYSAATRFQLRAIELYFGSDFFVVPGGRR